MQAKKIIELLNDIEKKFEVENWMIDDIHVWPLIRMDLMMSLHFEESKNLQIKINLFFKIRQVLVMLKGFIKYFFKSLSDYKKNDHPRPVDTVLLGDGISRVCLNGKWYDRFCDPLKYSLEKEKKTSFMIEPLHNYITPRHSPSLFIQPILDFSLLKNVIFKKRHFKNIKLKSYSEFINFLKTKKINIPMPDEERLKTIVLAVKSYAQYYEKILKITKPSQGFVVCYYGPKGLAFNLACYRQKIPSIDIQHGVAGEFNPAYGHWTKVPKTGYETLPAEFWCWTKEDAQAIESWNNKVQKWHKARIKGNMLADFWKSNFEDLKSSMKSFDEKRGTLNLLVTLSYVKDDNSSLFSKIIPVMKKSDPDWKWWIRLHPCLSNKKDTLEKMFHEEGVKNIEIAKATNLPLYSLLTRMDIHITYASATVLEAQMFGLHSIVTCENALQYFAEQISTGWAIYAPTSDEITASINTLHRSSPTSD